MVGRSRVANLLLLCLLTTPELSRAQQVCQDGTTFNSSMVVSGSTQCWQLRAFLPSSFVASLESCSEMMTLGSNEHSRFFFMSIMQPCCGNQGTVCAPFAPQICDAKGDFDLAVNVDGATCGQIRGYIDPFVASQESCSEMITIGSETHPRTLVLEKMVPCCKSGKHVCSQFLASICTDESNFKGDAIANGNTTCSEARSMIQTFTASRQTCDEMISMGDSTMTRNEVMSTMGGACCGGKDTMCTPFGAGPAPAPGDQSGRRRASTMGCGTLSYTKAMDIQKHGFSLAPCE